MSKKKKQATWITREGEVLQIKDMKDSHLKNTIAFLERKFDSKCLQINAKYLNLCKERDRRTGITAVKKQDQVHMFALEMEGPEPGERIV